MGNRIILLNLVELFKAGTVCNVDVEWTSVKAWGGKPFKKDYAVDY
jgi:hypothetical protein